MQFNNYQELPSIPYNIISHLMMDSKAEDLFKLLKYSESDALLRSPLTLKEKRELIWNNEEFQNDFAIFFTDIVENITTDSKTFIKLYNTDIFPKQAVIGVVSYQFDILVGAKHPLVSVDGIPCNRIDVIESILLNSLNGADVGGVGFVRFDVNLSRICRARRNIGNNTNYTGASLILALEIGSVDQGGGECRHWT